MRKKSWKLASRLEIIPVRKLTKNRLMLLNINHLQKNWQDHKDSRIQGLRIMGLGIRVK